jgi:tRNA nucleotidyltransferase/poly(A) polymerase
MSDYMFMLESHLSTEQNRVVAEVQAAAADANVNLFLTGGAVRDMMGGYPIRDLDFTVEGNALKLAKTVAQKTDAKSVLIDEHRKLVELLIPGEVHAGISMARIERYPKIGGKPQVTPATVQEDLRCRDFTFNSLALSLNRASLGLLLDPNNGLADLERKEVRGVHSYIFYDDPGRMLRMIRFKVRMGCTVDEKTQQHYENSRTEELEKHIPPRRLFEELQHIADETDPGAILQALEAEKLLPLFSPALTGGKLNMAGLAKLQKAKQLVPFGIEFRANNLALFLFLLAEKLSPKEKADLIAATAMGKHDVSLWQKLESRSKQVERELKSAKLQKASMMYQACAKAPGEEILFLFLRSEHRLVQDRIRNYLQKYLPAAQEITDKQVAATGVTPGTPKFRKLKEEMIATRLDVRVKKPVPLPPEEPPPLPGRPRGPQPPRSEPQAASPPPVIPAGRQPRAAGPRRQ